ncbi:MAG TPA: D-alanyl-D-alanine carboxypeptidase, partial [Firmicutes bacterium]|nr:D-alanyl-D-alanine carboxypeptidase [Bacillota bacterium]
NVSVVVRRDEVDALSSQVEVAERLKENVRVGQHAGWLRVFFDDEQLREYPLYTVGSLKSRG